MLHAYFVLAISLWLAVFGIEADREFIDHEDQTLHHLKYNDENWNSSAPSSSSLTFSTLYITFTVVGLVANAVVFFVIFCGNEISLITRSVAEKIKGCISFFLACCLLCAVLLSAAVFLLTFFGYTVSGRAHNSSRGSNNNNTAKTVTSLYVLQLAVADCAFLIVLPFFALQQAYHTWNFGAVNQSQRSFSKRGASIWIGPEFRARMIFALLFPTESDSRHVPLLAVMYAVKTHCSGGTAGSVSATCSLCQTVKHINYYAGVFFLTAMSIDRYVAVAYSTRARQIRTTGRTLIVCLAVWIASAIASLPAILYSKVEQVSVDPICRVMFPGYQKINNKDFEIILSSGKPNNESSDDHGNFELGIELNESDENNTTVADTCERSKEPFGLFVYDVFKFVFGFVLPFFVICVSYILIVKRLKRSEERLSGRVSTNGSYHMRQKVTRMVIALVVCFGLCWLPYQIYSLLMIRGLPSKAFDCLRVEGYVLAVGYSNSVFNPLLYTFLSHNFRKRLHESWMKTRNRMRNGSRIVTNRPWKPMSKFQSQATPVRFSRGQFSRMRPAENEKIACESERECSTVVTEPCSEEKKIVVRDNGKRAEVLRNQNTEANEKLKSLNQA